jgi:hypothetical protein
MLIVAVLCVALVGCGKARQAAEVARTAQDARDGEYTIKGEKGEEVKVETQKDGEDGKMTVTTKEGTTTTEYGANAVTEKDVGIAFYPGATVESGGSTTTTGGKDGGTWASVSLLTTDSFADVAKFYKDKYAQGNTVVEQPDMLMITVSAGENMGKMIMAAPDSGKVRITIAAGGSH